jgi:hypothetical protein
MMLAAVSCINESRPNPGPRTTTCNLSSSEATSVDIFEADWSFEACVLCLINGWTIKSGELKVSHVK